MTVAHMEIASAEDVSENEIRYGSNTAEKTGDFMIYVPLLHGHILGLCC